MSLARTKRGVRLASSRLVFACVGVAALALAGCVSIGPSAGSRPMSVNRHRPTIRRIEDLLIGPSPIQAAVRPDLAAGFSALASALRARSSSQAALDAAARLERMADWSRGETDLDGESLERLRVEWLRTRDRLFRRASWFRHYETAASDSGLPAAFLAAPAMTPGMSSAPTPTMQSNAGLARLAEHARTLDQMLASCRSEDREATLEERALWAERWSARLDEIAWRLPPLDGPSSAGPERRAHRDVLEAIDALRSLAQQIEPGDGAVARRRAIVDLAAERLAAADGEIRAALGDGAKR